MNRVALKRIKITPLVTLVCGIVTIVGVYLPWVVVPLYDSYTLPLAGWRMVIWSDALGESFTEPYLLLFGGIVMLTCSLPALIISLVADKEQAVKKALGIGISIDGALALVGTVWFLIHISSSASGGSVGFGFYICAVAVLLGLISGILMSLRAHRALRVETRGKAGVKVAGPLIILASGIITLAGVFMPWMSASAGSVTSTTSGWELTRFNLIGASNPEPFLVLAGSISMIVCGILMVAGAPLSIACSVPYAKARRLFYTVGALTYISGALALGGALWFAIPAVGDIGTGSIGYGIYISVAAAVVGAIIGMRTSMQILKVLQATCVDDRDVCRDCT
jgi:hypothetical protein